MVSMHLLVLSAFRPSASNGKGYHDYVSMHLLVLSAFRRRISACYLNMDQKSQCTFWCSVLSDPWEADDVNFSLIGLNAPFGAQCFPTAGRLVPVGRGKGSQCTFWCSVLSDSSRRTPEGRPSRVSMHLLVLSAFRQCEYFHKNTARVPRLDAPFGAQCFPTMSVSGLSLLRMRLNAPFGAQCFPTLCMVQSRIVSRSVSMHLLVLSAFRQETETIPKCDYWSQCTFWCSVLSD